MKKRTLKKLLSAVMAGTMAVGLLAGCSGGKEPEPKAESEGGATTIKFGIHVANPQEQEVVTYNIVQAFNEKYDGKYKVEFEASDKESHSKNMKLEASDGTLPQIFWLDASEAPEYSDSGVLMDLSDFLSENSDIQTALGGMENAFQDDNGQYGLPYQCNVQGIFYNKDLFDKAGIEYPTNDTTYEEFIEMIKKLKESGVTPLSIGSKNSAYAMWEFNETLARYGWAENIDSILSGEKKFNNEDLNACFEKLKGIADAGAFPENMATIEYFDAKQLFNEGKAAMFGTGQWDCAEFDENIGEKIGFWWGPKFTDTNYNQDIAMKVPSAPIVVNAEVADDDAVKEAVYEFLKFYYGEDAAKISYEGSIFPATNYSEVAATDTQYSMNAMLEALAAGWESPEAAPDLTVVSAVQEALYNSMFGVMQGTYEPSEALDKIDEALSYSK
ncbi:MAG: extracellular solute-binding protein [Clostridium sp.]|nr:extracellular solute-binding protein [Clostridium sp.]MDU7709904.1 extracellular solute-binding protein [Clostridium sp.]